MVATLHATLQAAMSVIYAWHSWLLFVGCSCLVFGSTICGAQSTGASGKPTVHATLDVTPRWRISPYLSTLSIAYAWAPDVVYSNGTFAAWAKSRKVATARYPAGQGSYYDWENQTGWMGKSRFDPAYKGPDAPPENWMSYSEYLKLCKDIGIRKPLVGVNWNCKKKYWLNLSDSLALAERQVKYMMSHGFRGAFYYIGNEDQAFQDPERVAAHARKIKSIDPDAVTFYNDNNINPERLKDFLKVVGNSIDGAEFHGKWPYGGNPSMPPGTYDSWLKEVPLLDRKDGVNWRDKIHGLRQAATEAGRPELILANHAWGLGWPAHLSGFNKYSKSMVNVEFSMEMFIGGYDQAAMWDDGDGGRGGAHSDQMLIDSSAGYRLNPVHIGLEMMSRATNETMVALNTSDPRVHGFAAVTSTRKVLCYLLNKLETVAQVEIDVPNGVSDAHGEAMVDTPDHWGTTTSVDVTCQKNTCRFVIPEVSLTMVTASLPSEAQTILWV